MSCIFPSEYEEIYEIAHKLHPGKGGDEVAFPEFVWAKAIGVHCRNTLEALDFNS
jgi:hypothetical protein